mgnify:CR=1 FL=1
MDTVAQEGEIVTPVYAIGGIDAYGNVIEFSNWKSSNSVKEDRQSPQAQLKLYDSQEALETSRWFTGGEEATFSNLESDNYSIQFALSDDVVSVTYVQSSQSQLQVLDLSQTSPHIDLSVSESVENITFTFTVMDEVGNVITFDTMFCTTCLIEPQVIVEPSNTDDDGDSIVYSLSHPLDDNQPNQLPGLVALPGNYPPPYELVQFGPGYSVDNMIPGNPKLNISNDLDIGKVDENYLYETLLKMDLEDADALFISCTALPVLEIIDKLEKKLNTIVLSSNQALIWDSLV